MVIGQGMTGQHKSFMHRFTAVMLLSLVTVGLEVFLVSNIYSGYASSLTPAEPRNINRLAIDRLYDNRRFTNYTMEQKLIEGPEHAHGDGKKEIIQSKEINSDDVPEDRISVEITQ